MTSWRDLIRHRLFWPLTALLAMLVADTIKVHTFLHLRMQDGHLYGAPIDIIRNSAPLILVALGMTLVIATRGIDLSVGAVLAISGAVALTYIASSPDPASVGTVVTARAGVGGPQEHPGILLREDGRATRPGVASGA